MRGIFTISALALGLTLLTYLACLLPLLAWQPQYLYMVVFLLLLTIITHQINLFSASRQGRAVIIPYLASTVLKLLLSSGFLIAMVWINRPLVRELVILFLVYYAAFSALEIFLVNKRLRQQKL